MLAEKLGRLVACALAGVLLSATVALPVQAEDKPAGINIDFASYNPVSLALKNKGWMDEEFAKDGIAVQWRQSQGSNKALQALGTGALDFGSTAGGAALLARAEGVPIKVVYIFSQPEWTALVTRPDSGIAKPEDLKGKRVAVTKGTDPHIFLLRVLAGVGMTDKDITLVPLQHADGRKALEASQVDAWAGLDPLMAQSEIESGMKIIHRDKTLNTYGVLNVREDFAAKYPETIKRVIAVYERGRRWALENPAELTQIVVMETKLPEAVIALQLNERTSLTNPAIDAAVRTTLQGTGAALVQVNLLKTADTAKLVEDLLDPTYQTVK